MRSRIEPSEAPWNTVSTVRVRSPQRSILRIACTAASRSAGEAPVSAASRWSAGTALSECRVPSASAAAARGAAVPWARWMSASASASAWRTQRSPSFLSASSTTGAAPAAA